jgi:hypothetical protein
MADVTISAWNLLIRWPAKVAVGFLLTVTIECDPRWLHSHQPPQ